MTTPALVVATASKYRLELLRRLGIEFEAHPHRCDEDAFKDKGLAPEDLAARLSLEKAQSLAEAHPSAYILGSDQLVDLEGEILGKPGSATRAVDQLMRMQGRSHRLITGVALVGPDGSTTTDMDIHVMRVRPLTRAEATAYVELDAPLDCAGSYKIEGLGICLFEAIGGEDFTAITGLPLICVTTMLRGVGINPLLRPNITSPQSKGA